MLCANVVALLRHATRAAVVAYMAPRRLVAMAQQLLLLSYIHSFS
jgi:hypothetical protein